MRRVFLCLAAVLAALSINPAFALPIVPDPNDPPPPTPSITMPDCVTRATTTLSATFVSYAGQQSTLHWDFQPFGTCPRGYEVSLTLAGQGVAFNGYKNVTNMMTTTYGLIASVTAGDYPVGDRLLASTTVAVPPPSSTVTISGNTVEWARYLALAVTQPNETVYLAPSLDLNMDTLSFIHVASNVKVLGDRDATRLGPRLFTQQRPKPLFVFDGDNIRFSGFRLQGPHWDPVFGEDNLETGIFVGGIHEEIDNMELSGWAGAA